jgi:hypothetical protein
MTQNLTGRTNSKWASQVLIFVLIIAFSVLTVGCSNNNIDSIATAFDGGNGVENLNQTDQILEEVGCGSDDVFAKAGASRTRTVNVLPTTPSVLTFATGAAVYDGDGFIITVDFGTEKALFRFSKDAVTAGTMYLLETDRVITIQGVKNVTDGDITYEYICTPHGLVFTDAVQLTQPYNAPTGTNLGLYYYNESSKSNPWELQETDTVVRGTAYFDINHFSKYGISR